MSNQNTASAGASKFEFKQEFVASVVVFLVALPLCMGIAIASGVPPALGLITGIVGGLVIGALSGSPLQVSGPAAGLSVLVYDLVQHHGVTALGLAVLIGGAIQIAAGAAKGGRWFRAVSPAVIHGMLAGIGVLIFASQFHVMVDDKPRASGISNLLSIPEAVKRGLLPMDGSSHHLAAIIGVTTIASLVLWNRFRPKFLSSVPGALVAVIVATAGAAFFTLPISYVTVPSSLLGSIQPPGLEQLSLLGDSRFIGAAIALAIIASAETLLCASAVDQMHDGERTRYDKELIAQGVGNMICGALGALPATGVIVRSSANVEAGAKTRYSAIMHGIWLLGLVAAVPFVLELIPTSALAAILVYTGYRLAWPARARVAQTGNRYDVAIFTATVVAIVCTDLLTGVAVGVALSLLRLLYVLSHFEVADEVDADGVRHVHLAGAATFVQLPKLAEKLESLPRGGEIHVDLTRLAHIDAACLELLRSFQRQHESGGGHLYLDWDHVQHASVTKPRLVVGGSAQSGNTDEGDDADSEVGLGVA